MNESDSLLLEMEQHGAETADHEGKQRQNESQAQLDGKASDKMKQDSP